MRTCCWPSSKRTGAFHRKILVVATTTGSGFLDPAAVDPLEYLWHGDTAIAGMQYSYLPNWLSLLADQQNVQQTAQVEFRTIATYWQTLPEQSRPQAVPVRPVARLVRRRVDPDVDRPGERTDQRCVHVRAPVRRSIVRASPGCVEPGSPPWRPVYQNGRTVRFTAQQPALESLPGPWGPTRIAYLQHGSDPVVFFSGSLLLHKPEWLDAGQRAPDVSAQFTWAPFVTFWQVAMDLPAAGSVPWGYGHLYPPSENVPAWVAVTRPPGWTDAQLTALGQRLDEELTR